MGRAVQGRAQMGYSGKELCCSQGERQGVPGVDETWSLWDARVATWSADLVEPGAEIAHEGVPGTDDLGAW